MRLGSSYVVLYPRILLWQRGLGVNAGKRMIKNGRENVSLDNIVVFSGPFFCFSDNAWMASIAIYFRHCSGCGCHQHIQPHIQNYQQKNKTFHCLAVNLRDYIFHPFYTDALFSGYLV